MEQIVKKPITSELRTLKVGASATFPIEQRSSVITVVNKLRSELIRERWDAVIEDDRENFLVTVTRTQRESE